MKRPPLTSIKTASQARDLAIDWQVWQANRALSYSELADWQDYFETVATKFNLTDEFTENGVI
jgi:hypothetical protein